MPMLLKEIKDRILKIVYDSAEHTQLSIDDFAKEFKRKTPMENKLVDEIAEQLKAGDGE